jgi:hypothetical protein
MAQTFPRAANSIAVGSILGLGALAVVLLGGMSGFFYSSYVTGVGEVREQPIPFSHAHHAGGEGLDCRYCHTSVEKEAFAGMPATRTCMTCHSQIWKDAPILQPVRDSLRTDRSLEWTRLHDLSDFVYFNHSIHVNKGVGCSTCHGRVDQMQIAFKNATLYMQWCINCHRNPEQILRPADQIFNMAWEPPANQEAEGQRLRQEYHLQNTRLLTSCSTCHR